MTERDEQRGISRAGQAHVFLEPERQPARIEVETLDPVDRVPGTAIDEGIPTRLRRRFKGSDRRARGAAAPPSSGHALLMAQGVGRAARGHPVTNALPRRHPLIADLRGCR
jgi:hypothetical protein